VSQQLLLHAFGFTGAEILLKPLVRLGNNIFAVLSFKASNGKMTERDRLEVVHKYIVDGSASESAYDRDSLRGNLLRNDEPEPRGDQSDQAHERRTTFLNDAAFSDETRSFRNGFRK
jgi:hypothetical protein